MGKITCYDISGVQLTSLYQWDSNRSIVISGVDPCIVTEVHFCNIDSEEALVVSPRVSGNDVTASIPNILLQKAKPILVYVFSQSESSESRTVESTRIVVIARPKPANYVYYETEVFSYSAIDKRLLDIEESISEMIKSVNGATPDEYGNVDAKPDWNVNDENSPGYIKNRPFYDVLTEVENVTAEEQVTCGGDVIPSVDTTVCIEERSIYKVIFDSVEHICEAKVNSNWKRYIGNGNRCFADIVATNEPFCLVFSQTGPWNGIVEVYADDGDHTIQVIRIESRPVKIDEKFIPNTVARTPDWNQNDSTSPSYIKNRPFYACYDRGPGDTYVDNKTFTVSEESGCFTITTGFSTSPAVEQGFYIVFDGTDYGCQTVQEVTLSDGNVELGMGNLSLRNPELEDNGLPFFIYCTYWGYYVFFVYAEPGEHTILIRKDKYEIKKIEETFIPDSIARVRDIPNISEQQPDWNAGPSEQGYIENRTHYDELAQEVYCEGVLWDTGTDNHYYYQDIGESNIPFMEGKIDIGGTICDFVTGVPFDFQNDHVQTSVWVSCTRGYGSYEIRLCAAELDKLKFFAGQYAKVYKEYTVTHQLDAKYLPDTFATHGEHPVNITVCEVNDPDGTHQDGGDTGYYIPLGYHSGEISSGGKISIDGLVHDFVVDVPFATITGNVWVSLKGTQVRLYASTREELPAFAHIIIYVEGIEVKQLDEKYIPDTIARVGDPSYQLQADWSITDSTKADYIKNKPFYDRITRLINITTFLTITGPCTTINTGIFDVISENALASDPNADFYCVVFDGSEYVCKPVYGNRVNVGWYLGNLRKVSGAYDSTGEPFAIRIVQMGPDSFEGYFYCDAGTTHEVIVYLAQDAGAKTLDEKYIPDTIARKSDILTPVTAEVGQHFRISAVDENGKVIAVEAVDMPSGGESYELPAATADALGGIKADPVTAEDIQPVRIGEDGKLYTAPGGSEDEKWELLEDITIEENVKTIETNFFDAPQKKIRIVLDTPAAEADTNYMPVTVWTGNAAAFNTIRFYPKAMPMKQAMRSFIEVELMNDTDVIIRMSYSPFTEVNGTIMRLMDTVSGDMYARPIDPYGNNILPQITRVGMNTYGEYAAGTRLRVWGVAK